MNTPTPEESISRTLPAPTPTQPVASQAVESTEPVFDWTPVPDADHYRLQIAATEAFDTLYHDEPVERPASISLEAILPENTGSVCWRVRAERAEGAASSWSGTAHFFPPGNAPNDAVVRVDAAPVPAHPDGSQDSPLDPRAASFSWNEIPEASGYQIQVAPAREFSDPAVDFTLDRTTKLTLYDLLPAEESPLYWRIRPLFRGTAPGPWSESVAFSVSPSPDEPSAQPDPAREPGARAAGPARRSQTSQRVSITISLVAILSFLVTILLIVILS